MNDLQKEINLLKAKIATLEKRIPIVTVSKWQPKGGHYYVDMDGEVNDVGNEDFGASFGVKRETEEGAERAAIEMRKFNRLLALRDELCGDVMVDWTNFKQEKFYLSHDEENKRWHIRSSFMSKASVAYFTTLESAQRARDMLNSGEAEL
jgi:hypothetical protein